MGQKRVLVVGSGYVAQHLVASLSATGEFAVCYTHRRAAAPFAAPPGVDSCALDLLDAESCAAALWAQRPDVVVNCAALASPAACEADEARAAATNCPLGFLECLHACCPDALLVHCSTDLVLAGVDDDGAPAYGDGGASAPRAAALAAAARPATAYGRTKLAFEAALAAGWQRAVVFRLSNVVGAPAPFTGDGKFAHPAAGRARAAAPSPETARFHEGARAAPAVFLHVNCGGPDCLSRYALGRAVANTLGLDAGLVRAAPRPPSAAPLRAPLDSSAFAALLRVPLVPAADALAAAFAS
ncbi:3-beta-hydroxy-delta-5-steroid dehydrogenase [Aureococcus anophagefferens]|nr:3-beta-hydroxy-delta-5-steroid dehydrogenase [Aureococcus anophagefferens]